MKKIHLTVATPDDKIFDEPVDKLIIRTTMGDVGILADHVDYFSLVDAGEAKIYNDSYCSIAAVCDALVSVKDNHIHLLATTFEWQEEIDLLRAVKARDKVEKALENVAPHSLEEKALMEKLKRANLRIKVSNKENGE